MRWGQPMLGDERIISYFAFFPVTVAYETRWLERVKIKQEFKRCKPVSAWVNMWFVDE